MYQPGVVPRANNIQGYLDNLSQNSMDQSNGWANDFNSNSGGASHADINVKNNYLPSVQQNNAQTQALQLDPWSYYRGGAADNLDQFAGGTDPSNMFRDKLTQMSTGQFSPDDPSYQWRLQQGQQTVERSLGARGLLNSGNAAIELQQYGQGAASQEYGAQFSRMLQGLSGVESQYNTQFSRLASMAGITLDPSSNAKINAGIQTAQLGANAQLGSASIGQQTGLANNQLAQLQNQQNQNMYAAYDQGLGNVLTGQNWRNGGM